MRLSLMFLGVILIGCQTAQPVQIPEAKKNMTLTSTAFKSGEAIPEKYSAYGDNISPELSWSSPPAGTKAFALLVEDPDAPKAGPFVHWIEFDIPPNMREIAEGSLAPGAKHGRNDAGTTAYFGPKPPSGTHHYHFRLFALDAPLGLQEGADKAALVKAMTGHQLGEGEIVGLYSK